MPALTLLANGRQRLLQRRFSLVNPQSNHVDGNSPATRVEISTPDKMYTDADGLFAGFCDASHFIVVKSWRSS